jgi:hypothetical protein
MILVLLSHFKIINLMASLAGGNKLDLGIQLHIKRELAEWFKAVSLSFTRFLIATSVRIGYSLSNIRV